MDLSINCAARVRHTLTYCFCKPPIILARLCMDYNTSHQWLIEMNPHVIMQCSGMTHKLTQHLQQSALEILSQCTSQQRKALLPYEALQFAQWVSSEGSDKSVVNTDLETSKNFVITVAYLDQRWLMTHCSSSLTISQP